MSHTAAEPTAAARRASEKVCRFATNRVVSADEIRKIAALIDCETHLPELIAACRAAQQFIRQARGGNTMASGQVEQIIAAALAAASIKPEGT